MKPYYIKFAPFGFVKNITAFGIMFDQLDGMRFESWDRAYAFVRELARRFDMIPDQFDITTESI